MKFVCVAMMGLGFLPHSAFAFQEDNALGAEVYETHCLTCHQADGSGVPTWQPPLQDGYFTMGPKGELIQFVIEGTVNQDNFDSEWQNTMPAFDFLEEKELATVLTYIRQNFGNKGSAVSIQDVKNAVKK